MFSNLLDETKVLSIKLLSKSGLKNAKILKLYFLQFFSVQQQNQRQITNLVLKKLFKKFHTALKDGLMKDLAGLLNQLILNTLIFQLLDLYEGVLT